MRRRPFPSPLMIWLKRQRRDRTAPTVSAAIDAAGTTLTLTFSESVTGVSAADFALSTGQALSNAEGSGTTWTLTTEQVYDDETPTLAYSGTAVEDAAGNALAAFSDAAVTNNSAVSGITYLWRDLFTTGRAAGAVNGTAAEPGTETRVVRDVGSRLTIASGKLEFAAGGTLYSSNGETRLDYGPQARANGVALYGRITPTGGDAFFGWGNSNDLADYQTIRHSFYLTGGRINYYNGSSPTDLAAYTNGVTYDVLLILRATGCYLYYKTAAATEWTLLHTDNSTSTATMTPGFTKGSTGTFSVDEIALIDLGTDWTTSDPLPEL